MTYDTERVKLGRSPVLLCDLELDKCNNTFAFDPPTNNITAPEDLTAGAWSTFGTMTKTANTDEAPDGTISADTLEGTDATKNEGIYEGLTGYGLSITYWYASIFCKKDTTGRATRFADLRLYFSSASAENNRLYIDTATGEFSTLFESTPGIYGVIDHSPTYWRAYISAKRISSNNAVRLQFYPCDGAGAGWTRDVTVTGEATAWGANLQSYPGLLSEIPDYWAVTCPASAPVGAECFNTRATCQAPASYNPVTPKIYTLSNVLVPGENFLNCIDSTELAPTVIRPDKGLGIRASIKVTVNDFPHHDRGIDPYVATRPYNPIEQGTYINKLVARNFHSVGRPLRIKTGYIGDTFDLADFQTRNYVIDRVTGPDSRGRFTITAKDILALADDARAVAPATSTGTLVGALTTGSTTLTVTSGTEAEYNESKYIRISDELILAPIANRAANVFSNLSRAQWNTEASAHDIADTVQAVKWMDADNVVDLVYDLLVNYGNIPAAYISTTDWDAARDTWYSSADINTVISEATGVTELINMLAEQYFFQIWWNEIDQAIIFNPIVPPAFGVSITDLADADNLIDDSVAVTRDASKRLSRVVVYYNPKTPIETREAKDYKAFYVRIDADAESTDEFGDIRQKVIFARFIDSEALAVQVGGRLLARYRNSPREIKFRLDAKDSDLVTGELADVLTRSIQDITGADNTTRFQITSFKELARQASGTHFEYSAIEVNFFGRYGYIGPNTLNDYDVESDANKAQYGFISLDTAVFSDGTEAYRII